MRNYKQFCDQCGCEIRGKMSWTGACYKCRKDAEKENKRKGVYIPSTTRKLSKLDKTGNKIFKSFANVLKEVGGNNGN